MTEINRPTFRELPTAEAVALLERSHVGRIAYTFHDRVDIEPIGYVYRDGWIYARTSPGAKLSTLHHHQWVAFQVDEIESPFDWRSVVVHGATYFLEATRGPHDRRDYDGALEVIRSIDPGALTEHDLTPDRTHLFRVHAGDVVGREARSK
jgi:nitroimidazol reductase NimA-like FMN-containing flavoprotein (pyridoxamine 5'-phosphate oxidase superfamily)